MNVYTDDIYDRLDNVCGSISGNTVKLYSMTLYIKKSRKKVARSVDLSKDRWICYKIVSSNWRMRCKVYSNEIELYIKNASVFTPVDIEIFKLVARYGSQFLYNKIFVPLFVF